MKTITAKRDAENLMGDFKEIASYDNLGNKYYFSFKDKNRDGKWTIMFYEADQHWSIHGVGETYCDEGETILEAQQLVNFLYTNRKHLNSAVKEHTKLAPSV